MKNYFSHTKKGFTLVELVIYMGLVSIPFIVFIDILSASFNIFTQSSSTSSVIQDGRFIYNKLISDINQSSAIISPSSLGESSESLTLTIDGQNYTYFLSEGELVLSGGGLVSNLNGFSTRVSDLSFQKLGNTSGKHTVKIKYKITANESVNGNIESRNFETTGGLR